MIIIPLVAIVLPHVTGAYCGRRGKSCDGVCVDKHIQEVRRKIEQLRVGQKHLPSNLAIIPPFPPPVAHFNIGESECLENVHHSDRTIQADRFIQEGLPCILRSGRCALDLECVQEIEHFHMGICYPKYGSFKGKLSLQGKTYEHVSKQVIKEFHATYVEDQRRAVEERTRQERARGEQWERQRLEELRKQELENQRQAQVLHLIEGDSFIMRDHENIHAERLEKERRAKENRAEHNRLKKELEKKKADEERERQKRLEEERIANQERLEQIEREKKAKLEEERIQREAQEKKAQLEKRREGEENVLMGSQEKDQRDVAKKRMERKTEEQEKKAEEKRKQELKEKVESERKAKEKHKEQEKKKEKEKEKIEKRKAEEKRKKQEKKIEMARNDEAKKREREIRKKEEERRQRVKQKKDEEKREREEMMNRRDKHEEMKRQDHHVAGGNYNHAVGGSDNSAADNDGSTFVATEEQSEQPDDRLSPDGLEPRIKRYERLQQREEESKKKREEEQPGSIKQKRDEYLQAANGDHEVGVRDEYDGDSYSRDLAKLNSQLKKKEITKEEYTKKTNECKERYKNWHMRNRNSKGHKGKETSYLAGNWMM